MVIRVRIQDQGIVRTDAGRHSAGIAVELIGKGIHGPMPVGKRTHRALPVRIGVQGFSVGIGIQVKDIPFHQGSPVEIEGHAVHLHRGGGIGIAVVFDDHGARAGFRGPIEDQGFVFGLGNAAPRGHGEFIGIRRAVCLARHGDVQGVGLAVIVGVDAQGIPRHQTSRGQLKGELGIVPVRDLHHARLVHFHKAGFPGGTALAVQHLVLDNGRIPPGYALGAVVGRIPGHQSGRVRLVHPGAGARGNRQGRIPGSAVGKPGHGNGIIGLARAHYGDGSPVGNHLVSIGG